MRDTCFKIGLTEREQVSSRIVLLCKAFLISTSIDTPTIDWLPLITKVAETLFLIEGLNYPSSVCTRPRSPAEHADRYHNSETWSTPYHHLHQEYKEHNRRLSLISSEFLHLTSLWLHSVEHNSFICRLQYSTKWTFDSCSGLWLCSSLRNLVVRTAARTLWLAPVTVHSW